ncbi:MAG: polyphosphate kinase 1 [Akkermansiaceae bacterium]
MKDQFINRELSWLEFNQRVLNEALREDLPLLERVKFLAITDSNLDEFFQVRLGGLYTIYQNAPEFRDQHGNPVREQVTAIEMRVRRMMKDQTKLLNNTLLPRLKEEGVLMRKLKHLSEVEVAEARDHFTGSVAPLLTPMVLDEEHALEFVPSMSVCVGLHLVAEGESSPRIVILPLPPSISRFYRPSEGGFVLLEELIAKFCGPLFPDEKVAGSTVFRLTRNTDIAANEDGTEDFAKEIRQVVDDRLQSFPVRLQISWDNTLTQDLVRLLGVPVARVYLTKAPLGLKDFFGFALSPEFPHLRVPMFTPVEIPEIEGGPVIKMMRERDIFLVHPYQSYRPVLRFIQEAAADANVLAVKQVLYRTAKDSKIVDALIRAARAGKQVTVLVELKARFDEAHNLDRAEELRRAGAQVLYGVKGLKTHAKITLVIRQEGDALRSYVHLGTGNYNEATAKLYTDVSYLTCRPDIGHDAALFFNAITGQTRFTGFRTLIPAPTQIKSTIIDLIEFEAAKARAGKEAWIRAKINSLEDREVISALYRAADAGVKIALNVRGICCMKVHENIEVVSIVDHFLEHMRIFSFCHGGEARCYISSADWMTRNLCKRVELMIPIGGKEPKDILKEVLDACFRDNQNASRMLPDGSSERIVPGEEEKPFRMQEHLARFFAKHTDAANKDRALQLEPHLPKSN